jgi:hypothetical protein
MKYFNGFRELGVDCYRHSYFGLSCGIPRSQVVWPRQETNTSTHDAHLGYNIQETSANNKAYQPSNQVPPKRWQSITKPSNAKQDTILETPSGVD